MRRAYTFGSDDDEGYRDEIETVAELPIGPARAPGRLDATFRIPAMRQTPHAELPPNWELDPLGAIFGIEPGDPDFDDLAAHMRSTAHGRAVPRRFGTVRVIPITPFSFAGDVGSVQQVPLGPRFDSLDWRTGALIVRLHTISWASTTATVDVALQAISVFEEQPDVVFVVGDLATVQLSGSSIAPTLSVAAFGLMPSDHAQLVMRATQGTDTNTVSFSISVDVVWRSP